MYGYEEYVDILPEHILQKVNALEIMEMCLGEKADVGVRYISPCRDDNSAGCRIEERLDGTILFVDFGESKGKTHRDCFKLVMDSYGVTFQSALKIICNHFGLSTTSVDYQPLKVKPKVNNNSVSSTPFSTVIDYDTRDFNKHDKKHWSQYLIYPEQLLEDKTHAVSRIKIDSAKGRKSFEPFSPCFSFDFGHHVKLYMPYNNPQYKWITNCDENDIGNIWNLPKTGKELIIQKSYKDHRVLRNIGFGLDVIWTQNEGCIPHEKILYDLSIRFDLITIFYDNDKAGRLAALKLRNVILALNPSAKVRFVYLPRRWGHKDPGEFINKEGKKDLQQVLQTIGIKPQN